MKTQHELSKEMLENLLSGAAKTQEAPAQEGGKDYAAFDWSQPCHFSKRQMANMEELLGDCWRELSRRLSQELTGEVTVEAKGASQRTAAALGGSIDEASFVVMLKGERDLAGGALVIDAQLGLAWIARLLGGNAGESEPAGVLSDLDRSLLVAAATWIVETVVACWKERGFPVYQIEGGIADDPGGRVRALETEFFVAEAKVSGERGAGSITLAFPAAAVDRVMAKLGGSSKAVGAGGDQEADRKRILEHLGGVPVRLEVRLGEGEVTLEELMGLEAGDVVVLDRRVEDEIEVEIADRRCFLGKPGKSSGKYAFQITRDL